MSDGADGQHLHRTALVSELVACDNNRGGGSNVHICFIHAPCPELDDDRLEPPLGLLYIATYLQHNGFNVSVVDLSSVPIQEASKSIPKADIYGFSTLSVTYAITQELKRAAKKINPSALTVAGGPHATALPFEVSKDFDIVVTGEGETAMLYIARARLDGLNLPKIVQGRGVTSLDFLPFPNRDLVDLSTYSRVVNGQRSLSILTARGCPFRCAFCNSNIMGAGSKNIRFRSPENVAQEIRYLQKKYHVSSLRVQDDTFTTSISRIRKLAALLKPLQIRYRCFGRVDKCANREMTDLLFEGGCRHIAFGVESGSQQILDAMRKRQTINEIRDGIKNAKASGLVVRVYLIVGFPGETWKTVQQTIDLMQELQPNEFIVYPLIPYPGTPIWERPQDFGITHIDRDYSKYVQVGRGRKTAFAIRTKEFDERQVEEFRHYMIEQLEEATIQWAGKSARFK
jgi:anaerobic magnesium-protoporphyrin IX monomethyl ester cyclase